MSQRKQSCQLIYPPEVLHAGQGAEGSRVDAVASVQEQITHDLGVVEHGGGGHAEGDWGSKGIGQ